MSMSNQRRSLCRSGAVGLSICGRIRNSLSRDRTDTSYQLERAFIVVLHVIGRQ